MKIIKYEETEVICQDTNPEGSYSDFAKMLHEKGIEFKELPILSFDYVIYKYKKENETRYAVLGIHTPLCFITTVVPELGWDAFWKYCVDVYKYNDVPKEKTRLEMVIRASIDDAYDIYGMFEKLDRNGREKYYTIQERVMYEYGIDDYELRHDFMNDKNLVQKALDILHYKDLDTVFKTDEDDMWDEEEE